MRTGVGMLAAALAVGALLMGCSAPEPGRSAAQQPPAQASSAPSGASTPPSVAPTPTAEPTPSEEPAPSARWDIDAGSSITVLVNKRRPLQPQDYAPELVEPSVSHDAGEEAIRPEVDAPLVALDAAMRADIGEGVHVFSSYRSFQRQTTLYSGYVARSGQAAADTTSARPGHSEHQTGLAMDVVGTSLVCRLDVCFGGTAAGRWIAEHAWEHGFVVRYPEGEDATTGYAYEPWHLRYVGVDVTTAMQAAGATTLEAFFGTGDAPDYG